MENTPEKKSGIEVLTFKRGAWLAAGGGVVDFAFTLDLIPRDERARMVHEYLWRKNGASFN